MSKSLKRKSRRKSTKKSNRKSNRKSRRKSTKKRSKKSKSKSKRKSKRKSGSRKRGKKNMWNGIDISLTKRMVDSFAYGEITQLAHNCGINWTKLKLPEIRKLLIEKKCSLIKPGGRTSRRVGRGIEKEKENPKITRLDCDKNLESPRQGLDKRISESKIYVKNWIQ
jgi:hypothetical protein